MKLFETTDADFTSDTYQVQWSTNRAIDRVWQVDISDTATVKIQGRVDSTMGWIDLHEFTASGYVELPLIMQMQVVVSNNNGTVVVGTDW